MKSAVVFGAGSIGRGFIGALLCAAGWKVTFVDVVDSLVDQLNADGAYNQVIVDVDGEESVRVAPVDAVRLSDEDSVARALLHADVVATAVGPSNLGPVAALIAASITAREKAGVPALDVLLCENLHDAPAAVRALMIQHVGAEVAARVGLVATSIGRMVPVPIPDEADPTRIRVEPYSYLPYDAAALLGSPPDVPGLVAVHDGFALYQDRKLYVHNMGHCMLAYLGELRGLEYVWQAVADLELRYLARGAMVETALALAQHHDTPGGPLLQHVDDLLARFSNHRLADTTERVGRDPVRKMQRDDRILGSYSLCRRAGVTPSYVSVAVAVGALKLSGVTGWDEPRVLGYLDDHLFAPHPDPQLQELLHQQMALIRRSLDVGELTRLIDASYIPSRLV